MKAIGQRLAGAARTRRNHEDGVAAVEFSMIIPIMLVPLFGMIEVTSGFATNRKLRMATRALSDLVSQGMTVSDTDINAVFTTGGYVMAPHAAAPLTAKISQVKVTSPTNAVVDWSKSARPSLATARRSRRRSPQASPRGPRWRFRRTSRRR